MAKRAAPLAVLPLATITVILHPVPLKNHRQMTTKSACVSLTVCFLVALVVLIGPARGADAQQKLLRLQYQISDPSFCQAATCVDYDNDGKREILFASRKTRQLQMLNAADGAVRWSKKLSGEQQSISAFDLDGDGEFEILYTVSNPGRLYVLDGRGNVKGQWDSGDGKLGNSPVIVDLHGDGQLTGFFGTRTKYLVKLGMNDLAAKARRDNWVQCGCYTSAMDVDGDGKWDFFAGSGDDYRSKGSIVRFDPVTLKMVWRYDTNDNASSADPVLVDIDRDGQVEIIKSVDNYAGDDAHDAIYAFETDGKLLWKRTGFAGEDSPNVADLDGDGNVEIVGMTFGGVVYCLDGAGQVKWKTDLRPELTDKAHAYMTPVLGDVNGDARLEILAMTNGGYNDKAAGIVFALSAEGKILDQLNVGGDRYWGNAFYCNIDDDPYLELVVSGSGGVDVIETRGLGPSIEHFQRRRSYARLNVVPWAYEDEYFIYRGKKENLAHRADALVLTQDEGSFAPLGKFTTETLSPPPGCVFSQIKYIAKASTGTHVAVNIMNVQGQVLAKNIKSGAAIDIDEPLKIAFVLSTSQPHQTPVLDSYRLSFSREALNP